MHSDHHPRHGQAQDIGIVDPVVTAIEKLLLAADDASWCGTASELLEDLMAHAPRLTRRNPAFWPQTPIALGVRLKVLEPTFAAHGIVVAKRNNGTVRGVLITYRSDASPEAAERPARVQEGRP